MNLLIPTWVLPCLMLTGCASLQRGVSLMFYDNPTANSSPVDTTTTEVKATSDRRGRAAELLSAFYGLDDALPRAAHRAIGQGAGGADGMPVIFSHEIDPSSMQAGDFKVTTASGKIGTVLWATLAPADDPGELRTVLLAGHYGSIDDPPVRVDVVGNLLSIDGTLNFQGASIQVTPLEAGPALIWAEWVPKEQWDTGVRATPLAWGGSSGAPHGTRQVVRVTWAGGVTKPGGDEIDDRERLLYRVKIRQADGREVEVIPFAMADLGDGDNNHELCLDVAGVPMSVSFPAGHLTDPNEDLNPNTTIPVQR